MSGGLISTGDRFRAFAQSAFDLFWIVSPDGEISDEHESWQQFTGRPACEAPGKSWLDAVYSPDRGLLEDLIQRSILSGQSFISECLLRRFDGIYRTILVRSVPVRSKAGTISECIICGNDITEQKRASLLSKEQLHLSRSTNQIGEWQWDLLNGKLTINDALKMLFGLAQAANPTTYSQFLDVIHPDDRENVRQILDRSLRERTDCNIEFCVLWPDGSPHWMTAHGRGIYDIHDNPLSMVGAVMDVTAQRRAWALQQLADKRASIILDGISDAVFCVDSEWRIVYVNSVAEEVSHRKRDEILGTIFWEYFPATIGTSFEQKYREAMETQKSLSFEMFYSPLMTWLDVYVYPSRDGLSIYFHDITERKRAENALRESEAKFRRLVESNIIGVLIVDKVGRVCETNDAFLQLLGYTRSEFETKPLFWRDLSIPEFMARDRQAVQELNETGMCKPYEKDFVKRDGTRVPVLLSGASLDTETIDGWFAFVVDITARKEIEQQKDIFISVAGHELRTPLAGIKGNLQLVKRRVRRYTERLDVLPPGMKELVDDLDNRLTRSLRQIGIQNRLISDILDVSRIAVDKLELSLEPCNLVKIVQDVVEDFRLAEPEREIVLEPLIADVVTVLADEYRIAQVLSNYLTNALKYTEPGTQVRVGMIISGDLVRVWVQDFGPGLSEDDKVKVWGRFHQLKDRPPQGTGGVGLGLGLYICETLIGRHRGQVGVQSSLGHGSTFWFELPVPQER
ncbi:MAG TPA: PAS domain S-box protein [Ktedonobacteraceae bacterium]|nr:PAS domain S-box protein [Ktedonobacteraceae bacterium]